MQGIVGEGYTRVRTRLAGEAHTLPNDGSFHGDPAAYMLPHYSPFDSAATHKMLLPASSAYRRLLAPVKAAKDPLLALAAGRLGAESLHVARAWGDNVLPGHGAVPQQAREQQD